MLRIILIMLCLGYTAGNSTVKLVNLQLNEGSPCTWQEAEGRCVNVHKCLSAILDIKDKDYPPTCSYDDKTPIICCTDCTLVNDTRLMVINSALGILNKTGHSKAKDKCIDYIHTIGYPCKYQQLTYFQKILNEENKCYDILAKTLFYSYAAAGGRNAVREEFPHMALLGYGETMDSADWLCGGSLISERFILTAAHCISTPSLGPVKYVALGILQRSDPPDTWERYNVKRIIPHPQYKAPSKYHDIALLETDREITFSDRLRPACLHTDKEFDSKANATGWGALGHKKELADVLQVVSLDRFNEEECAQSYPEHRHLRHGYNHTTQMCYGDRFLPKDTCMGDSGGPLQSTEHERCVYTILGVTSFGRQCGISEGSGIYTRVRHYVPWIEEIVWP